MDGDGGMIPYSISSHLTKTLTVSFKWPSISSIHFAVNTIGYRIHA